MKAIKLNKFTCICKLSDNPNRCICIALNVTVILAIDMTLKHRVLNMQNG